MGSRCCLCCRPCCCLRCCPCCLCCCPCRLCCCSCCYYCWLCWCCCPCCLRICRSCCPCRLCCLLNSKSFLQLVISTETDLKMCTKVNGAECGTKVQRLKVTTKNSSE